MKKHTVTATIILALVAVIIFAGVSNVQQTAASSGQSNTTTQDTTHTKHDTPGNDAPGSGCYHYRLRHCSMTSEI